MEMVVKKHGFSLIRSAIVLGIIGLVLGSIWVGAATLRENMLINKTVQGTGIIANHVRQMYSGGMREFPRPDLPRNFVIVLSPLPDGYTEGGDILLRCG